jgi:2-dehydro-3-deoxygalactonokinase
MHSKADFFSCDWGTTSFRLRRVSADTGEILEERRKSTGVKQLSNQAPPGKADAREKLFADFLRAQLLLLSGKNPVRLHSAHVIISGMASSSVGWRELNYARVPVDLDGSRIVQEKLNLEITESVCARVHLVSGLRTDNDILRGEEAEIIGLFAEGRYAALAADGLVILPGTHSKHVRLQGRRIIGFQTFMTGELFEALSAHSLLRTSVQPVDGRPASSWSQPAAQDAFREGVRRVAEAGLAASLFQTRVRTVLNAVPPSLNRWFLSGVLIGAEMMDLANAAFTEPILLAATESLSSPYQLALETIGLGKRLTVVDPAEVEGASVRGHRVLLGEGRLGIR